MGQPINDETDACLRFRPFYQTPDADLWIIELVLGKNLEIKIDDWQDGVVMLRYDEAIFVTKEMIAKAHENVHVMWTLVDA